MPSDATTPAPRALVSPSSGDSAGRRSLAGRLSQVSRFVQGSLATSTQADEGAAHTVAARPDAADMCAHSVCTEGVYWCVWCGSGGIAAGRYEDLDPIAKQKTPDAEPATYSF